MADKIQQHISSKRGIAIIVIVVAIAAIFIAAPIYTAGETHQTLPVVSATPVPVSG
jgi:uncharacterized membrane protein YkgB